MLEEKRVAGFHASVIETKSATALVDWLRKNGYDYSPAVETWARPYVESGWKITALKVAKSKDDAEKQDVAAKALRMSFKTDRPLFPYTEPDHKDAAKKLEAGKRLLRIFFVADVRYRGKLDAAADWTGKVAWAGKLSAEDRSKLLDELGLPDTTGPAEMWLTEFEDFWPYKPAAADLVFSRDPDQKTLKRPPTIRYVRGENPDAAACAFAAVLLLTPLMRIVRSRSGSRPAIGERNAR